MKLFISTLKIQYRQADLETRVLMTSLLSGMFICFTSAILNYAIHLDNWAILTPLLMGLAYTYFIHEVVLKNRYKFAAYGSLIMLTTILFPIMWFSNAGIKGSIPFFYVFMIFLTAVVLNNYAYRWIVFLQLSVLSGLIYIDYNYSSIILPYASPETHLIDMTVSLFIIIGFIYGLLRYIMREYHQSIVELKEAHTELEVINRYLKHSSITDELTTLHNRRYIMELLSKGLEGTTVTPSTLIMIDIDYFKSINDEFGHSTGDLVLKTISDLFKEHLPPGGHLGRIGGEEFLIFIESLTEDACIEIAEGLRTAVENYDFGIKDLSVTISAGIYTPTQQDTVETTLKHVDTALYAAKNAGRNQTSTYKTPYSS